MTETVARLFYSECDKCAFYIFTEEGWCQTIETPKPGDHVVVKIGQSEKEMVVDTNLERRSLNRRQKKMWDGLSPEMFEAPIHFEIKIQAHKIA